MMQSYESFYDRLATLPDEALLEASEPSEDEREHGYIDEEACGNECYHPAASDAEVKA